MRQYKRDEEEQDRALNLLKRGNEIFSDLHRWAYAYMGTQCEYDQFMEKSGPIVNKAKAWIKEVDAGDTYNESLNQQKSMFKKHIDKIEQNRNGSAFKFNSKRNKEPEVSQKCRPQDDIGV